MGKRIISSTLKLADGTFPASTQQLFVSEVHTLLTEVAGLVQTNDSGQLDIPNSSIATPAVSLGFRVYRFNDALQSVRPIFLRLDFGVVVFSTIVTAPTMRITLGQSSDGSGNLLGQFYDSGVNFIHSGSGGGVYNNSAVRSSYICSNESGFWIVYHDELNINATGPSSTTVSVSRRTPGFFFGLWRTTSPTGVPNADGVVFTAQTPGVLNTNGTFYNRTSQMRNFFSDPTKTISNDIQPYAVSFIDSIGTHYGQPLTWPLMQITSTGVYAHPGSVAIRHSNLSPLDVIETFVCGENRKYLNFGTSLGPVGATRDGATTYNTGIALHWDGPDV